MRPDLINALAILWDDVGGNDPETQMTAILWTMKIGTKLLALMI
jgi:hypothetical protein